MRNLQYGCKISLSLHLVFNYDTKRKGGKYKHYLHRIKENQLLTPDLIEQIQLHSLKQVISHAFDSVPFYQEWSRKNRITGADINCLNDISVLPIIEKEDIRQNPKHYCSSHMLKKSGNFTLHTSGTTGMPLVVFCDKESRRLHFAYWERFCEWFGVEKNAWRATFCGRIAIPQKQEIPPFWRYDPAQRNVLFSSYHLSENNIPFYVKKLRQIQPDYLDGYPSSLAFIANYMLVERTSYNKPKSSIYFS